MDYGEPSSYMALEKGVDVIATGGEKVGTVERVIADEPRDIFEGVVIHTHLGPGGHRFVQADQVDECFERAVVLKIDSAAAEDLPEPPR
jgi:hypothetical protein